MIFAIDFDGTIAKNGWPNIHEAELIPEAQEAIQLLHDAGHIIIIWSCREGKDKQNAIDYLCNHDVPFDYFNENPPGLIQEYNNDSRKIGADYYIDDKNFGKWSWDEALDLMEGDTVELRHERLRRKGELREWSGARPQGWQRAV